MEPKTFNTLEIDQDSWFDEGDTKMTDKKVRPDTEEDPPPPAPQQRSLP
jgi:hypothetical protein